MVKETIRTMKIESELPTVTEPTGVPLTCICPFVATGSAGCCGGEVIRTMKFESELPTVTGPTRVPSTCICPFAETRSAGNCADEIPLKSPDCVTEGEVLFD